MTGPIRSVSQAFAVLRLLAESRTLSLSDIGRSLDLSPSSAFNLLKTLVAEGVIERDARTKHFAIAPAWADLEGVRDTTRNLADRAQPLMTAFAQSSEAAVGLWKMVSRERLQLVAHAASDAGMRLQLADAQRQPLGGGAAGRALAAVQKADDAELARRFAPVRWQADLSFETYARQVRDAVTRGFAIDQEYAHRGVCTVATGLADIGQGFCLSASILAGSRSEADVAELGAALCRLRDEIMRRDDLA